MILLQNSFKILKLDQKLAKEGGITSIIMLILQRNIELKPTLRDYSKMRIISYPLCAFICLYNKRKGQLTLSLYQKIMVVNVWLNDILTIQLKIKKTNVQQARNWNPFNSWSPP